MTAEERADWLKRLDEQSFKVRLLFDENLPRSLETHVKSVFPQSLHVSDADLLRSDDRDIWEYASAFDLTIVTKDSDFAERVSREGAPPSVVQISCRQQPGLDRYESHT